jgi:hypothetical protein
MLLLRMLVTVVILIVVTLLVILVVGVIAMLLMLAVAIIVASLVRMARHFGLSSCKREVSTPVTGVVYCVANGEQMSIEMSTYFTAVP